MNSNPDTVRDSVPCGAGETTAVAKLPEFNRRQREGMKLLRRPGNHRLHGPVGSGKSTLLALHAVERARAGERVLVTCFNIAIIPYLRELAVLAAASLGDGDMNCLHRITWEHFHAWSSPGKAPANLRGTRRHDAKERWLRRHRGGYDAVIVDEGQDFRPEWIRMLREALRRGGTMTLAVDYGQDLYNVRPLWEPGVMQGCGFSGKWIHLMENVRMPDPMVPVLDEYRQRVLDGASPVRPNVPAQAQRPLPFPLHLSLHWCDLRSYPLALAVRETVGNLAAAAHGGSPADIAFLASAHGLGMACEAALNGAGIDTRAVFARNHDLSRPRKMDFTTHCAAVKGCTYKSFKGWESRIVVLTVTASTTPVEFYLGLSRLRLHPAGNTLVVLSDDSNPVLTTFAKAPIWRRSESMDALQLALQNDRPNAA